MVMSSCGEARAPKKEVTQDTVEKILDTVAEVLSKKYGALGKASVKPKKRMALHGWKRNLVPGRLTKDYFLNHLQLQAYYILTFVCLCVLAELDHLWSSALAKMYGRFTNFSQQRIKYKIFTFFLSSLFVSIAPQHHLSESYLWYQILLDPNHIFFPNDQDSKGNLRREHPSWENLRTEMFYRGCSVKVGGKTSTNIWYILEANRFLIPLLTGYSLYLNRVKCVNLSKQLHCSGPGSLMHKKRCLE